MQKDAFVVRGGWSQGTAIHKKWGMACFEATLKREKKRIDKGLDLFF